jgi:hypothetical protein
VEIKRFQEEFEKLYDEVVDFATKL